MVHFPRISHDGTFPTVSTHCELYECRNGFAPHRAHSGTPVVDHLDGRGSLLSRGSGGLLGPIQLRVVQGVAVFVAGAVVVPG